MNENQLIKAAIQLIRSCGHLVFRTHRPGQWAPEKNVPDLAGTLKGGKSFYIEMKGPRGKTDPEQQAWLANAKEKGAVAFEAWSLEEVVERLGLEVLL